MDATTKQKTLSGVLVALLLGSVFVVAVPASAQHPNPSGAGVPVAVVNAIETTTVTFAATTWIVNTLVFPTDGPLRFNATYDLTITNISQSAVTGATGYGYGQTSTGYQLAMPGWTAGLGTASPFVLANTRPASDDLAHTGKWNVTFPSAKLNATGAWRLIDGADNVVAYFFVMPAADLTLSLSQSSFPFSASAVSFTATVGNLAAGQTATLTDEGSNIPSGTTVTGSAGGQYVFFGALQQAGAFAVNATRQETTGSAVSGTGIGGSGASSDLPEHIASATYTVTPGALTITANDTSPKSGFEGNASWNVTYPNATSVFIPAQLSKIVGYNWTVTGPSGYGTLWLNTSPSSPNSGVVMYRRADGTMFTGTSGPTPGEWNFTAHGPSVWVRFDTYHNVTFQPNKTWEAGSYAFSVTVDRSGLAASEFTGSWNFAPATPAAVNVDLFINSAAATNVTVLGVGCTPATTTATSDPPCTPAGNALVGPPGYYDLTVKVTGRTQTQHPTGEPGAGPDNFTLGGFLTENVTVTGDVMILANNTGFAGTSYNPSTGVATIPGIVPLKAPGTITVTVRWLGETVTKTIPIVTGAKVTATPTELVVDTTTSVTFHLTDQFGNNIPDGKIFLFKKPSGGAATELVGANSVNGTGAPGAGQNGLYTLSLKPNTVGKYIVYAQVGQPAAGAGTTDHRRFAYAELNVVPAHDVAVTMSTNSTMASVTTYVFVNATTPDGVGLGTTSSIYFLTEQGLRDLRANGSTNLSGYPTAGASSTLGTVTTSNAGVAGFNLNVTLAPNTYYVYVCSAAACANAKHDNNQSVPTFTVSPFRVTFTPDRLANNPNIQANTTVNVTVKDASGNPWNGSLVLSPGDSVGSFDCVTATGTCTVDGAAQSSHSVTISNGNGSFVATGLGVGAVWFRFDPAGSSDAPTTSLVDTAFQVVGPNVIVTPDRIPIGKASTILITVKSLAGDALPNLSVRVCGTPIGGNETNPACTGTVLTGADGTALVGVNPLSTGTLSLYVNNVTADKNITVYAGLVISFTPAVPVANTSVTITVNQVGQTAGEQGVTVSVTKNGTAVNGFPQTTNSNGQVVLPAVTAGTYTVTAAKPGFQNATETLIVGQAPTTPPTDTPLFTLHNLQAPTSGTVGTPVTVSADVHNEGTADGTATVLLLVNGAVRGSEALPIAAGGEETIAFEFTPSVAGSFRVTVKLSTGQTLAEEVVTVSTPETPTVTAPTGGTQPTVSTTPVTSTPATTTPNVPGFEVVALLGALAIAMLVLRRRN